MEPLSMIMMALVAGLTPGLTETTKQGVKDAYDGLKSLLKKKFTEKSIDTKLIDEHEQDHETWEKPLEKSIVKVEADKDQQIIEAARKLLELSDPAGAQKGMYNVQFQGDATGTIIGNYGTSNMHFGNKADEK